MELTVYPKWEGVQMRLTEKKWHVDVVRNKKNSVWIGNGIIQDHAIRYDSGKIVYDFPDSIPKYAKKLVSEAFKLIDKMTDIANNEGKSS